MNLKIDLKSGIAYPTQLKNAFKAAILSGELKDQAPLPDYQQLYLDYGYSEDLVRKAYNELIRDGFAHRIKKRGVFVHHTFMVDHMVHKMTPILQEIKNQGYHPSVIDLKVELIQSDEALNQKFEFKSFQSLVHLTRLFKADGIAVLLMDVYYPHAYFNHVDISTLKGLSMYPLIYESSGLSPSSVEKHLSAILINQKQAELLEVRKSSPGGLIEGHTRDQNGQVMEVFTDIIPGDRLRFII